MPSFRPTGVCATRIDFEIDKEGMVHNIIFTDGCPGTSAGLALLAEDHPAAELIELLRGLPCGRKATSCPDQLARALSQELAARNTQ